MWEDERGEGEERETERERGRDWNGKQGARARGRGGRNDSKKLIARTLWGGVDHLNPSVTISPSSPVKKSVWELSEREREREGLAGPLRGQRKKLSLRSSSLCVGPTAARRHLASHWSLISTDREEEKSGALWATEKLHIPSYPHPLHSPFCCFPVPLCCFPHPFFSFTPLIPSLNFFLILDTEPFLKSKKIKRVEGAEQDVKNGCLLELVLTLSLH